MFAGEPAPKLCLDLDISCLSFPIPVPTEDTFPIVINVPAQVGTPLGLRALTEREYFPRQTSIFRSRCRKTLMELSSDQEKITLRSEKILKDSSVESLND